MARAQENLLRQQKPDGHWCGELLVDSTLCSDFIVFMHWLGDVEANLQERCVRHILKRQLPDGGWNIYHGGPSEINASVKAYFALKLAGCSPEAPFMCEARATIMRSVDAGFDFGVAEISDALFAGAMAAGDEQFDNFSAAANGGARGFGDFVRAVAIGQHWIAFGLRPKRRK